MLTNSEHVIKAVIPKRWLHYRTQAAYLDTKTGIMVSADGTWCGFHPPDTSRIGYILHNWDKILVGSQW
jgi:hypothetical protein